MLSKRVLFLCVFSIFVFLGWFLAGMKLRDDDRSSYRAGWGEKYDETKKLYSAKRWDEAERSARDTVGFADLNMGAFSTERAVSLKMLFDVLESRGDLKGADIVVGQVMSTIEQLLQEPAESHSNRRTWSSFFHDMTNALYERPVDLRDEATMADVENLWKGLEGRTRITAEYSVFTAEPLSSDTLAKIVAPTTRSRGL